MMKRVLPIKNAKMKFLFFGEILRLIGHEMYVVDCGVEVVCLLKDTDELGLYFLDWYLVFFLILFVVYHYRS